MASVPWGSIHRRLFVPPANWWLNLGEPTQTPAPRPPNLCATAQLPTGADPCSGRKEDWASPHLPNTHSLASVFFVAIRMGSFWRQSGLYFLLPGPCLNIPWPAKGQETCRHSSPLRPSVCLDHSEQLLGTGSLALAISLPFLWHPSASPPDPAHWALSFTVSSWK